MGFVGFFRANSRWLLAGMLLSFASGYGQTYFISLFAGQIRAEFDLSHGEWGGIYTVATASSAAAMIWAGTLTDRFRVRTLAPVFLVVLAAACLFMFAVPVWWALFGVVFLLRFSGQGMLSHISSVAMARWFQAARGRALAIGGIGFSIGEAFLPMIFVSLMAVIHWRSLWLIGVVSSVAMALIIIPLLRVERTPQSIAAQESNPGMLNRQWTRAQVIRHWFFWLVFPSFLGPSMYGTVLFFQQAHLVEIKGWELIDFARMIPVYTFTVVVSTLLAGWAVDRWSTGRLMPWYQVPMAMGWIILALAQSGTATAFAFIGFGLMGGANSVLIGAIWAEYFGTKHLGAVKSVATSITVFGSALGPGITGALIDFGIGYEVQMFGIAALVLVSCGMNYLAVRWAQNMLPVSPKVHV